MDSFLLFWVICIFWVVCLFFWMTCEVWQKCCNLKHNYTELQNIDEEDVDLGLPNPFIDSSDSDLDDITYENNVFTSSKRRKKFKESKLFKETV